MIDTIRLVKLIEAFSEIEGCCENCPAYDNCYQGAECEQVIYKWLEKKGNKK